MDPPCRAATDGPPRICVESGAREVHRPTPRRTWSAPAGHRRTDLEAGGSLDLVVAARLAPPRARDRDELVGGVTATLDGCVVVPQVGQIFVSGLTKGELEDVLYTRLGRSYSGISRVARVR